MYYKFVSEETLCSDDATIKVRYESLVAGGICTQKTLIKQMILIFLLIIQNSHGNT